MVDNALNDPMDWIQQVWILAQRQEGIDLGIQQIVPEEEEKQFIFCSLNTNQPQFPNDFSKQQLRWDFQNLGDFRSTTQFLPVFSVTLPKDCTHKVPHWSIHLTLYIAKSFIMLNQKTIHWIWELQSCSFKQLFHPVAVFPHWALLIQMPLTYNRGFSNLHNLYVLCPFIKPENRSMIFTSCSGQL